MNYSIYCENKENKAALIKLLMDKGYQLASPVIPKKAVYSLVVSDIDKLIYISSVPEGDDSFGGFVKDFNLNCAGSERYFQSFFVYSDDRSYDEFLVRIGIPVIKFEGRRKLMLDF